MKKILLIIAISLTYYSFSQNDQCKCCTEKHQEFDFWIGTWDVTTPNGKSAGKNVIEKIQDKCIIRENWTSAKAGYTGTSNNFYNQTSKQWEQLWVDNQGASLHLKGNREGNKMILESDELKNAQGQLYINRVTWTANKDGTVRQLWEIISDGKVINVAFDGLYKKVE